MAGDSKPKTSGESYEVRILINAGTLLEGEEYP